MWPWCIDDTNATTGPGELDRYKRVSAVPGGGGRPRASLAARSSPERFASETTPRTAGPSGARSTRGCPSICTSSRSRMPGQRPTTISASSCREGFVAQANRGGRLPLPTTVLALKYLVPSAGPGVAGVTCTSGIVIRFSRAWRSFFCSPRSRTTGFADLAERASHSERVAQAEARRDWRTGFAGFLVAIAGATCAALLFRAVVARPYRVRRGYRCSRRSNRGCRGGKTGTAHASQGRRSRLPTGDRRHSAKPLAQGEEGRVKRVVGLPGDRIGMRGPTPVINGWVVPACDAGDYFYLMSDGERAVHGRLRVEFLEDRVYLTIHAPTRPFPETYLVKPGEVFVLGGDRGEQRRLARIRRRPRRGSRLGRGPGHYVPRGDSPQRRDRFRTAARPDRRCRCVRDSPASTPRCSRRKVARCLADRPAVTSPPPPLDHESSLARRTL